MKRFNALLALILLILLPLQGLAASISVFRHQLTASAHAIQASHEQAHACHQTSKQHDSDHQKQKNDCVSACGQLNMAAINLTVSAELAEFAPSYVVGSSKTYLSVLLPKLQRPPIQTS